MREKLAKLLVRIAHKLSPNTDIIIEKIAGYEAKKLGVAIAVSPLEISHYRRSQNCSFRKARAVAIKDMKMRIRQSIYGALLEGGHFEYSTHKQGEDIVVEGYIRIYQRKK